MSQLSLALLVILALTILACSTEPTATPKPTTEPTPSPTITIPPTFPPEPTPTITPTATPTPRSHVYASSNPHAFQRYANLGRWYYR